MAEVIQDAPSHVDPRLRALKRVAVVPAYNEEGSIGAVIDEIRAVDREMEIVVVDDGSRDRTADVAAAKGARVLRLPFNVGIGGAVQTGYRHAPEPRPGRPGHFGLGRLVCEPDELVEDSPEGPVRQSLPVRQAVGHGDHRLRR